MGIKYVHKIISSFRGPIFVINMEMDYGVGHPQGTNVRDLIQNNFEAETTVPHALLRVTTPGFYKSN